MAHFVEQYTHMLRRCEDYDSLSNAITNCISNNVINSVSTDIKEAIDRLGINTPYYKFMKTMVWASSVSDHTETSLNLLRYFCNKITKEFDSMTYEPDEFSLMVLTICADDKQFLTKVTDDRKLELYNTISNWYLCTTNEDKLDDGLQIYILTSFNLILNGKISMQELDWEFRHLYENIRESDVGTAKAHRVNEIIRPFQAILINIIQNINQKELLNEISLKEWQDHIYDIVKTKSLIYEKKFNNGISSKEYAVLLNDALWAFKMFNDDLVSTGYNNIENAVVGRFILCTLETVHRCYSQNNMKPTEVSILLRDAKQIFYNSYAVAMNARNIIDNIFAQYCESGEYEDTLVKGEYFSAIKAFLHQDEAFRLWAAITDNDKMSIRDRVYATYVDAYMNKIDPSNVFATITNDDLEVNREIKPEVVTEAKSERWDPNSEDDQDEPETEYDGPEIEAKQSTKGYKRSSKLQADSERKIYKAYKKYKDNEAKVDSQLSKMLGAAKKAFTQDKTEEIIEGKKFTPLGLLKKILLTAAIFNYSKIAGFVYLIVSHTISKKRTDKQKREILLQIETEIKMIDEKIEDARGDGNRKAKYALMRTKAELIRARDKIKYNLTATKEDMKVAKAYIENDSRDNL